MESRYFLLILCVDGLGEQEQLEQLHRFAEDIISILRERFPALFGSRCRIYTKKMDHWLLLLMRLLHFSYFSVMIDENATLSLESNRSNGVFGSIATERVFFSSRQIDRDK